MEVYEQLLKNNEEWAKKRVSDDPEFFARLANLQTPPIFMDWL